MLFKRIANHRLASARFCFSWYLITRYSRVCPSAVTPFWLNSEMPLNSPWFQLCVLKSQGRYIDFTKNCNLIRKINFQAYTKNPNN